MLGIHQSLPVVASDLFRQATELGADTFQVFLRNNRNMRMRTWTPYSIEHFNRECFTSNIWSFVVHAPYAVNPGTAKEEARTKYVKMIIEDLQLLQKLAGKKYYVLHPGSANTCSYEQALCNLKSVLEAVKPFQGTTTVVVEFMAGQGTQLLRDMPQIKWCIDNIPDVRFCCDTCHVFAAGMNPLGTLMAFKDYIDVLHINNSETIYNSRVDRHANLREGKIPINLLEECYEFWTEEFPMKPAILETPSLSLVDDFYYLKRR